MTSPMSVDHLLSDATTLDTGLVRQLALRVKTGAIDLDRALTQERGTRRLALLRLELRNLETSLGVAHIDARTKAGTAIDARTKAGTARSDSVDYDVATVRAWALAIGMDDVPTRGRYLPDEIVAAWRKNRGPM